MSTLDPEPPRSPRPDRASWIPASLRRAFVSFEERDFRYLGLSSLMLGFGQWGQQIALPLLAVQLTGSAVQIGIVAGFRSGVGVLTAPLGGYLADRFPRRTVIVWTTASSVVQACLFAGLILTGQIQMWHVYVLAFAGGLIQSFSQPARQAFVYDITTDDTLMNAVAMNSVMQNVARIAGPPLAGLIIGVWGTGAVFLCLATTQLLAMTMTLAISLRTRQLRSTGGRSIGASFTDIGDGFRYTLGNPLLLGLMLAQAIPLLLVVPYLPFLTLFGQMLHPGAGAALAFGLLSSMAGWGSIIGLMGLVLLGDTKRKGALMIGAFTGYMLMVLVFTRSTSFPLSLGLLVVVGIFSGAAFALNNTLVQIAAKNEYRGRVLSVWKMISSLQFLGGYPMGLLIDRWGPANGVGVFAVAGVLTMLVFILTFGSVRRA